MWQVLKYACPEWHPGLTAAHSDLLESVQKRAIRIFYSDANYQYQTSLIVIGIDTLHERRDMPTTKFFKRHVLASSSVLIDETTTLLAACEMRNPFTHFEHINKLSKSFITYCLDRYTQLFPVTHSVITALYSNLGYLVRLVYWLNSLVIAVYISFICVLFFMTSFCASLIQHLMLQYSINHWLMLIIGTRSWWNCRDRLVKS